MPFTQHEIDAERKQAMRGVTWHEDLPSPALEDLRLLRVWHRGFAGERLPGELVTTAALAEQVLGIFEELFRIDFPMQSIRPMTDFAGDDGRSMAANNSSCFNSRRIINSDRLSAHALGRAIDINPVQNPVIRDGQVRPEAGKGFLDRSHKRPGMIVAADPVHEIFAAAGWRWGGEWDNPVDYHHFYLPD